MIRLRALIVAQAPASPGFHKVGIFQFVIEARAFCARASAFFSGRRRDGEGNAAAGFLRAICFSGLLLRSRREWDCRLWRVRSLYSIARALGSLLFSEALCRAGVLNGFIEILGDVFFLGGLLYCVLKGRRSFIFWEMVGIVWAFECAREYELLYFALTSA